MTIYIFDGTLEGFMNSLPYLWNVAQPGDKLQSINDHNPEFFTPAITIDNDLSQKFNRPSSVLFRKTKNMLMHCFSSKNNLAIEQTPGFLIYIKKTGINGFNHLADPTVGPVMKAARKTLTEAHNLKGLLRFRQIKDVLYAPYFSKNFVLPILGRHFKKRLPNLKWIIHDTEHKTGLFYNGKTLNQAFFDDSKALELEKVYEKAGREDCFEQLWIKYFNTIAIKERHNPKLQQSFMPKQYWKFIPEVAGRTKPSPSGVG